MLAGFIGTNGLGFHQGLGQRMIDGQLFDLASADQISPAIAHPGDENVFVFAPDGQDHGGTHVAQVTIQGAHGDDFFVGLNNGFADDLLGGFRVGVGGEVLLELAGHHFGGALAGDLARCLTAHTVRHHGQGQFRELLDINGVFVVFPVIPQQGTFADVQGQRHRATSPFIFAPHGSRSRAFSPFLLGHSVLPRRE